MRNARRGFALAFMTAVLVAPVGATAATPGAAPPYFDVAALPAPPVSGKQIADDVSSFSTTFAHRVTGTPAEKGATDLLVAEAKGLGYDVQVVDLPLADPLPGLGVTHAVIATRKGVTHPDEHLVFTAHYDNVPQTINGAYDNGTGATMLRALARSFSKVPTNRTLVFAWYNGEEEGTLSSAPHAQSFLDAKKTVRGVFGFDMVGIGWPVAAPTDVSCLCMWHGDEDDDLGALLRHVAFDVLHFPDQPNLVEMRGSNTRNSDEASWDTLGYPTMRWAGMKTAADYPAYHMPDDTMATIDDVAGGRAYFEQGLHNTLLSAYLSVLVLDNAQPVAAATATGSGPVRFDASASSDADGPVGIVSWDFGDGTKGTGTTINHAYRRAGTYTASARVADALWPQVASTVTVPVTVTRAAVAKRKPTARKAPRRCVKPKRTVRSRTAKATRTARSCRSTKRATTRTITR